jgi:DNA recombination protein RmuC
VGNSLNKTVSSYNKAVGSLETRFIPTARKFNELGVGEEGGFPEISEVDHQPREVLPGLSLEVEKK